MKYAKFITCESLEEKSFDKVWGDGEFNGFHKEIPCENGILTVKNEFSADPSKKVEKITLRATGLGIFDLFVNGNRVHGNSDGVDAADELKPGWTDYKYRVFEFEYDITELCADNNLFVAEVSRGWWSGKISKGVYGCKKTAFCGEIEILYQDGESTVFASDTDWDVTVAGPVMYADIYDGEYYDATQPDPSVNPEAYTWEKAVVFDYDGKIEPVEGPRVRACPELYQKPLSAVIHSGTVDNGKKYGKLNVISKKTGDGCEVSHLSKGQGLLLDMGQNMVGRPVIMIKAPKGTKIQLFFGEMLNSSGNPARGDDGPEGSIYMLNYRAARSRVVYIAQGSSDPEYYFPTHSFFGFRYIEVRTEGECDIYGIFGEVIRSACSETGDFFCDNPEVNKLYSNIVWGMRGNYLSIPTDCPQRDERAGWTGDTQIFSGAASYIADIDSFMRKWLGDARHSQIDYNGFYGDIIPNSWWDKDHYNGAAWAEAPIIVPYRLWEMYNDTDLLKEHYASMELCMSKLEEAGFEGADTNYGDWLAYDETDWRYISVCFYLNDLKLMAEMSEAIGQHARAEYYANRRKEGIALWKERYIVDGKLFEETQTSFLLPLAFDIVDGELKESFVKRLSEKIIENNYTLTTGFIGTGILNKTLSKVGLDKLAYSLLLQTRDPSWIYSIRQGATTIWERWNSYTIEKGFGDVGMNSFNHYSYGAVAEWFFSGICGIQPDHDCPGFEHFILRPTPDFRTDDELPEGQKQINMAHASYAAAACELGDSIESGWEKVNGHTVYTFVIPDGLAARVELIAGELITVNGLEFTLEELGASKVGDRAVFELGSGTYEIKI